MQCFGPFRKHYVKLPSHLDGSQPQSIFSIGTKPGEQGSASRHNRHALQHTLSPFLWAFSLLWVTLQMQHTHHMHHKHCCYGTVAMCARCQGWGLKLWHTDTAEGAAALRVWWHCGQNAVGGPCGGEKTRLITQHWLGLCIGKNLAIRYVSRYRGCDTIYCDTVARRYIGIFLILRIGYIFRKAVIKNTPPYANLS